MFVPKDRLVDWSKLFVFGRQWRLIDFQEKSPPTWESYLASQREYWGADKECKIRFHHYFKPPNSEQKFLEYAHNGYSNFVEYLSKWNGIFQKQQVIYVSQLADSSLLLQDIDGLKEIRDHKDIVLELWESRNIFRKRTRLECRIFTSGTVTVPYGSDLHVMGEKPGSHKVWHRCNNLERSGETNIWFDKNRLKIDDAYLEVIL